MAAYPPDSSEHHPTRPQNEPDPVQDISTSSHSSLGLFPMVGQRGLPPELRFMIYDYVVTPDRLGNCIRDKINTRKYKDLLPWNGYILFEDTSNALALLRNGTLWEVDASYSLALRRNTNAFTLLASWGTLSNLYYLRTPKPMYGTFDHSLLLDMLKTIDILYALDIEHQRTHTGQKSWNAPLHGSILRNGVRIIRSHPYLSIDGYRFLRPRDSLFIQTMLLQLRRKPEINVRIYMVMPPWEGFAHEIEVNLKTFISQLRQDLTVTRLPRPWNTRIRHRITVVLAERKAEYEDRVAYWKERLRSIERDIEFDRATREELEGLGIWPLED